MLSETLKLVAKNFVMQRRAKVTLTWRNTKIA